MPPELERLNIIFEDNCKRVPRILLYLDLLKSEQLFQRDFSDFYYSSRIANKKSSGGHDNGGSMMDDFNKKRLLNIIDS